MEAEGLSLRDAVVGLPNIGNTCPINTSLQLILTLAPIRTLISSNPNSPLLKSIYASFFGSEETRREGLASVKSRLVQRIGDSSNIREGGDVVEMFYHLLYLIFIELYSIETQTSSTINCLSLLYSYLTDDQSLLYEEGKDLLEKGREENNQIVQGERVKRVTLNLPSIADAAGDTDKIRRIEDFVETDKKCYSYVIVEVYGVKTKVKVTDGAIEDRVDMCPEGLKFTSSGTNYFLVGVGKHNGKEGGSSHYLCSVRSSRGWRSVSDSVVISTDSVYEKGEKGVLFIYQSAGSS